MASGVWVAMALLPDSTKAIEQAKLTLARTEEETRQIVQLAMAKEVERLTGLLEDALSKKDVQLTLAMRSALERAIRDLESYAWGKS